MNTINVLVLLEIIFVYFCLAQSNDCVYDLSNPNERPKNMPFVLDPISLKHYSLIDNKIMIPINGKILLKCDSPYGNNSLDLSSSSSFYPLFVCSNDNKLMYNDGYDRNINFFEASCKKSQFFYHKYEKIDDKCENGVKISISYIANRTVEDNNMKEKVMADIVGICFDNVTLNPVYTHIKLSNKAQKESLTTIGGYVNLDVVPVDFEELHEENYIPATIDYLFNISSMNSHLNKILDNNMFLDGHKMTPVHLVTKNEIPLILNDLIDNTRLTRIPMWEILLKENWQLLQEDIHSLVFDDDRNRDFDVYAGTHGILTLPNRFGILQHLYLQNNYYYGHAVPVPEYVWKIIYSSEEQKAVAIVAYNNPYATNITESIFCKNVCDQILWLRKLDSRKILSGPVFCCEFLDFRKTVQTMPLLNDGVLELLTN